MKKSNSGLVVLVIGVLLLGGSFYGGMKYGQTHRSGRVGNFRVGNSTNFTNANGSFVGGQILSKDDKSITVKLPTGGSKIIFIAGSTQIMKSATGSMDDLSVGQQVSANGTANSDGSISATTVSIQPAIDRQAAPAPTTPTNNTTK